VHRAARVNPDACHRRLAQLWRLQALQTMQAMLQAMQTICIRLPADQSRACSSIQPQGIPLAKAGRECGCLWLQDLSRVQNSMEAIDKMRSRGLKKEQLEEYAVCEKLKAWLEVRAGVLARLQRCSRGLWEWAAGGSVLGALLGGQG